MVNNKSHVQTYSNFHYCCLAELPFPLTIPVSGSFEGELQRVYGSRANQQLRGDYSVYQTSRAQPLKFFSSKLSGEGEKRGRIKSAWLSAQPSEKETRRQKQTPALGRTLLDLHFRFQPISKITYGVPTAISSSYKGLRSTSYRQT